MAAVMSPPTRKKWHDNDDTEVVSKCSLASSNIHCPLEPNSCYRLGHVGNLELCEVTVLKALGAS